MTAILTRDLLMNFLMGLTALVILVLSAIAPAATTDPIDPPGNLVASIAWPAGSIDVDLWVKSPGDEAVGYSRKYSRSTPINPVAVQLCRSGECMCGTMQSKQERAEAATLYPEWGNWLTCLEREAMELHGYGWGDQFPKARDVGQGDLFQPMCKDCMVRGDNDNDKARAAA